MPSQSGSVYGLTLLCPILDDDRAVPSHDLQIRHHLAELPPDANSPFAKAPGTHIARLVVLDDVIYVGMPSHEEHLKSKYLVFESNCDGDRDSYLTGLAHSIPEQLNAIWQHCTGYPGTQDIPAFLHYMKMCEIDTTLFFAPFNDKTVTQTLKALQTQRAVADFIATHQGTSPTDLQQNFIELCKLLDLASAPKPAATTVRREINTGGRNE
jgi:hypothetical protein